MRYAVIIACILVLGDLIIRFTWKKEKGGGRNNRGLQLIKKHIRINNNEAYQKERKLLQKSGTNIDIESFQFMKISVFMLVLILGFTVLISYNSIKKTEILNRKIISINIVGMSNDVDNEDLFLNQLTKEAHENIQYKKLFKEGEEEELQKQVNDLVNSKGLNREQTLIYSQGIYNNLVKLNNIKLKPINLLILLLLSLAFLNVPKLIIIMKVKNMESMMEEELNKLEIFTLLLLKNENINIYQIIAKLYDKADVLKPYFLKCLNNYQRDGKQALENMQEEVDLKAFTDFINILKQGIDTNKKTTGNVLEISRRLRNSIRTAQIRDINKKKHRYIIMARFPMIIMGLYMLMLPWLIILRENM